MKSQIPEIETGERRETSESLNLKFLKYKTFFFFHFQENQQQKPSPYSSFLQHNEIR